MINGLGHLVRVDEPDAAGNLGSTASPVQKTEYEYDVLGNLKKVIQVAQQRTFTYDSLSRLRTAINPESGTVTYRYDDNGNVIVKTDARGVSTHYDYDSLNRMTRRWYNGSSSISQTTHNVPAFPSGVGATDEAKFYYDSQTLPTGAPSYSRGSAVGRLVAQTYGLGSTGDYYAYDVFGRQNLKIQQTGAVNYQLSAGYTLSGAVSSLTYPSGHTINNTFDQAGRLTVFSGNLGDGTTRTYATGSVYSAVGGLLKEQFGTNTPVYHKLHYNSRAQLCDVRASNVDDEWSFELGVLANYYSTPFTHCGNGSDNNGNVLMTQTRASSSVYFEDRYSYDSLNRLTAVHEYLNGTTYSGKQEYDYDRWGNRTLKPTSTLGTYKEFTVNTANNRLGVPAGQPSSIVMDYDNAGNLINDTYTGAGNRTYDGENKITSAWGGNSQAQLYGYDPSGQRIKRTVDGVTTWQVYGFGGELIAEYPANGGAASPQKEYGYRNGQLLVTAESGGSSSTQSVIWQNVVGVSVNGNSLTKTAATGWGNAGASSAQSITAGDGFMELTVPDTTTHRFVGLSNGNSNSDYTDVDFAIHPVIGGTIFIYEGGVSRGTFGSYTTGDVLRVAVEGGVVKYRKNGTLLYTSTITPTYPLLVDSALHGTGDTLSNVVISGAAAPSTQSVIWENVVGVSVNGNSLTKTAATGWGNAGASSAQSITAGDGFMELTVPDTTTHRFVGLSNGNSNSDYTDVDFAIHPVIGGTIFIYEGGVSRGTFGSYTTGDVLRVAVEGGVVKYRKNGTLLYTSTVTPTYPLLVDSALHGTGDTLSNVVISGAASGAAKVQWLISDHLSTPRIIIDQTGTAGNIKRRDYLPFGEELSDGDGGRTAAMGYAASDGVRQQFTGYERDNETGLDYAINRYYASLQGRFTSVDPLMASAKSGDPQSWNRYNYVGNNPMHRVDPNGLDWWFDSMQPGDLCPVWKDRDPGGTWRRWTGTYSYIYYAVAARKWVALDPRGNQAHIAETEAEAQTAFQSFVGAADGAALLTPAERDFVAGVSTGISPFGVLLPPLHEANGIDTSSREYAWGTGAGSLMSFGIGFVSEASNTVRVGRWMSQEEYEQMAKSGLVQESKLNGVTSVSLPPNPDAYRDAAARSVYVEFNVPTCSVKGGDGQWAKIYGPNSIFGQKLGITQMPPATGITPIVSKTGKEW